MQTANERADARLAWARTSFDDPTLTLESASSDASFRSYWRTRHDGQSWIVMDSPPAQEDPRPWLDIGRRLAAAGLHVPTVKAQDLEQGFLLIEDLGTQLYLPALNQSTVDTLYADAMAALLRIQSRVDASGLPPYDRAFLQRELEIMPEWFLGRHLGHTLSCSDWDVLEAAFTVLLNSAQDQPQGFVHRDFHSRNLLVVEHDNPGIIDFQGALAGPITYDLASLLRDCYIAWEPARIERWVEEYRLRLVAERLLDPAITAERFRRWFDLIGLQRHIKVLGIFCRLHYRDGKPGYLDDLPRVFRYVIDVADRYPELRALAELLQRCVEQRDLRQPVAA